MPEAVASTRCACGGKVFARESCRSCYRKLGSVGLPVGDDGRSLRAADQVARRLGQQSVKDLARIFSRLDEDALGRVKAAIEQAKARTE